MVSAHVSTLAPLNVVREETGVFLIVLFFFLAGFALMAVGAKQFQTGRLIKNTPPERVRSMAVGRTELHGTARSAGVVFDQPFTPGKCLYYKYSVQEEREWKERNKDGETETKRQWKTVSSHSLAAPFYLDDGTGEVLVLGNGGASYHISGDNRLSETFRRGSKQVPGKYRRSVDTSVDVAEAMPEGVELESFNLSTRIEEKLPLVSVGGSGSRKRARTSGSPKQPTYRGTGRGRVRRRRIRQEVLPVDEEVYVYGAATIRDDAEGSNEDRLVIQGDDDTGRFIVSCRDESGLSRRFLLVGSGYVLFGLVVSTICVAFLAQWFVSA